MVTYDGEETSRTYTLTENTMSYTSVTNLCSMPYNFLFNLLQETRNPEYVMAVADLLLQDTELVVMIQDQITVSELTHIETFQNVQKIVETRYSKHYTEVKEKDPITGETSTKQVPWWRTDGSTESFQFPAGTPEIHTTITTTYNNTATVFIKEAKTWCLDFEQEAIAKNEYPDGTTTGGVTNVPNTGTNVGNSTTGGNIKSASGYGLATDATTYKVDGITKSYNIAWISDIHTVANHEGNWGKVNSDQKEWMTNRYNMFKSDIDGTHSADIWDRVTKYLNEAGFDAVIFGGDTLDYYSDDNYQILINHLSQLKIPYVFIYGAGDHDMDDSRTSDGNNAGNMKSLAKTSLDLGEIEIVGILNSANRNGTEVANASSKIASASKPVLVATHVPFDGAEDNSNLESWSKSVHNGSKYYWTRSDTNWTIQNNDSMNSFLNDHVYNTNSKVFGVVAGHVHMGSWEGNLTSKVKEHIFPATYRGYVGHIRIEPADGVVEEPTPEEPTEPTPEEPVNPNPEFDSIVYETHDESEYRGLTYYVVSSTTRNTDSSHRVKTEISLSEERLLYLTTEKLKITKYGWEISATTEKRINFERFLGLWKNETGKYEQGALFEEKGKLVRISFA